MALHELCRAVTKGILAADKLAALLADPEQVRVDQLLDACALIPKVYVIALQHIASRTVLPHPHMLPHPTPAAQLFWGVGLAYAPTWKAGGA